MQIECNPLKNSIFFMTDDTKIGSGGALKTGLGYLLYQRNPRNSRVVTSSFYNFNVTIWFIYKGVKNSQDYKIIFESVLHFFFLQNLKFSILLQAYSNTETQGKTVFGVRNVSLIHHSPAEKVDFNQTSV